MNVLGGIHVIKSDAMYKKAMTQLETTETFMEKEREKFVKMGLTSDELELAMQPIVSAVKAEREQLIEYKEIKEGKFPQSIDIKKVGWLLTAARIYRGWTQAQLGEKLGVAEAQVARDERNEYYGASLDKVSKVAEALGLDLEIKVKL